MSWLWFPFIPYGKLTIIQGDPGDGKTTFILNIAAKLSKGEGLDSEMNLTEPLNVAEQGRKLTVKVDRQKKQISRPTSKVMEQSGTIERLREKVSDLGHLERHLGREQVRSIVERSKALEQAERVNKRSKCVFEMSR